MCFEVDRHTINNVYCSCFWCSESWGPGPAAAARDGAPLSVMCRLCRALCRYGAALEGHLSTCDALLDTVKQVRTLGNASRLCPVKFPSVPPFWSTLQPAG